SRRPRDRVRAQRGDAEEGREGDQGRRQRRSDRARRRRPERGGESRRGDRQAPRPRRHPDQQRRHQPSEAQLPQRLDRRLEPDRGGQPLGNVLLRASRAAGHARAQGGADHQHLLLGRALRQHAHRPGLQRDQARGGRAHRVDQHGGVHERYPRDFHSSRRGGDADPGEAPGAAAARGARAHAAGRGPRQDHPVRRHAAAARVRERAHHQPDLEPLLRRRAGIAQKLIFFRIALPFIAGYFVSYVYRMVNAVLAPTLAAEFGLSAGGLGLLSSMYFLSFAVCQLPVGVAMDRFGPRRVNAALLLVAAAGGAWFAHADSAAGAMAARALIGVGVSACLMASLTAFVLWYPADRLSTMNAIAFSAGALGAMTTTVPLELLLRVWPWRQAFLLIVGLTVAVSLVLWLWVPERSARARGDSIAQQT